MRLLILIGCAKQRILAAEKNEHKLNLRSTVTFFLAVTCDQSFKMEMYFGRRAELIQPRVNSAP